MIIKCSQVRARGPALKRLIAHLDNADDNEVVVSLRGHFADILDARTDAQQFGREYAAVHWIISPEKFATDEMMLEAVDRLAAEFHFDAARVVVRGHKKSRAAEAALFDRHVHVLAPAIDPSGAVAISLSHSFARNEKLARTLEYDWGGWANPLTRDANLESFNRGVHLKSVIATLERSNRNDVAAALKTAFPKDQSRPVQSFDTANQQRLKRAGFDLPALRVIVATAWDTAATRDALEASLSGHGLMVRAGDKSGVYMITTEDGTTVGSLARLAKATKAAVIAKMERHNAGPEEAHDSGSHIPEHPIAPPDDRADQAAGGAGARHAPTKSDRDDAGDDRQVPGIRPADHREARQDHRIVEHASDRKGDQGYAESLIQGSDFAFALGLSTYATRLHDMLALATRNAMPQDERVVAGLGEIEDEARLAKLMIDTPLPEPASLGDARARVVAFGQAVFACQSAADRAVETLTELQRSRPWWRRALGFITGDNVRHDAAVRTANVARDNAQLALKQARDDRAVAEKRLDLAIRLYKDAAREHTEKWTQLAADADARITAVKSANELWKRLPGASALGAAGLYNVGLKLAGPKHRHRHTLRGSGGQIFSFRP